MLLRRIYSQYIVMILTGIQILFLVVFITEDLRFPWWAPALASKSRIAFSGGISGLNFTSGKGLFADIRMTARLICLIALHCTAGGATAA